MDNNTTIIKLGLHGSSLTTRDVASSIREDAIKIINGNNSVLFDFGNVYILSSAFADELFGKLFNIVGENEFKSFVRINGFDNEEARQIISLIIMKAIDFRKSQPIVKDSLNTSSSR